MSSINTTAYLIGIPDDLEPRYPGHIHDQEEYLQREANKQLAGQVDEDDLYKNVWHVRGALRKIPDFTHLPYPFTPLQAEPYIEFLVNRKLK